MSSTRAIRKVELDTGKRAEMAYFCDWMRAKRAIRAKKRAIRVQWREKKRAARE